MIDISPIIEFVEESEATNDVRLHDALMRNIPIWVSEEVRLEVRRHQMGSYNFDFEYFQKKYEFERCFNEIIAEGDEGAKSAIIEFIRMKDLL